VTGAPGFNAAHRALADRRKADKKRRGG